MPEHEDCTSNRDIDLAAITAARELESAVTDHPAPEELIALQEDTLGAERAEQIRTHLVACPGCLNDLERLDAFDGDGRSAAPESEPAASEESWGRFQRRLTEPSPRSDDQGSAPPTGSRPWWLLAASLTLVLAGVVALLLVLQADPEPGVATGELQQPLFFDVLPDDSAVFRGAPGLEVVGVPAEIDVLVARLLFGDPTLHPGYTARLVNSDGVTVWSQKGVRRQDTGTFVLLIPRSETPPGTYRLHLLAEGAAEPRRLATYTFRLEDTE